MAQLESIAILLDISFIIQQSKERCAFCLYHRREMKNITLFFKSLFSSHLSNDVAALLSDHEPERRLLPSQSGSLFYLRLERFKRSWPLK